MGAIPGEGSGAQKRREEDRCLQHRERHANADARPKAERHELRAHVMGLPIRGEPLGIEAIRVGPQLAVAVDGVDGDDNHRPFADAVPRDFEFAPSQPRHQCDGWIES